MKTYYLNELKKRFKIRNRFWRKHYTKIKPDLDKLYCLSIIRNYFPFRIAFSKTILKMQQKQLKQEELEYYYLKQLVHYLNLYKNRTLILNPEQKAKLVEVKNKVFLNIMNTDGSDDPDKRMKIYEINQRILNYLKNKKYIEVKNIELLFIELMEPKISKLFLKTNHNMIEDFLESPMGKTLNTFIPGLNILLEISKQKELLKEKDYRKLANSILLEQIKLLTQRLIYTLMSNAKNTGKYLAPPLAFIINTTFERFETYKKCSEILNKNLKKLYTIKEHIQKNSDDKVIVFNHHEDIKKLLAM